MDDSQDSLQNTTGIGWRLEQTYAALSEFFYSPAQPVRVRQPRLVIFNRPLARELGLDPDAFTADDAALCFSGQVMPPGALPIAQAYAGHQYGHFTMLGDGRAILLGEQRRPDGSLVDVQWKGAGPTRFSRRGDGLAALGPMLREYVISEAMAALGIPTTRSLAVVATGEPVFRTSKLRGAILTRVAASHLRVGTFEYAARSRDPQHLQLLADYTITRHAPELAATPQKYLELLQTVCRKQASLIAHWQLVGFIHGVMNTDNMALSGETIDYGPCAFMNAYHPATVYSSIDQHGRYAYGNQPGIAQWNLARFAETLLPLLQDDQQQAIALAAESLEEFALLFQDHWLSGLRRKLGLQTSTPDDQALVQGLLDWMQDSQADWTNTFRDLSEGTTDADIYRSVGFQAWSAQWQQRLQQESAEPTAVRQRMQRENPAVIPRNHLVEEALLAAEAQDDLTPLQRLLEVVSAPYVRRPELSRYYEPSPQDSEYQTFCGT